MKGEFDWNPHKIIFILICFVGPKLGRENENVEFLLNTKVQKCAFQVFVGRSKMGARRNRGLWKLRSSSRVGLVSTHDYRCSNHSQGKLISDKNDIR